VWLANRAGLCSSWWVTGVLRSIGKATIDGLKSAGEVALLGGDIFRCAFKYPVRWRLVLEQIYFIGIRSQLVVAVTGAFTGAVFAAQVHYQFSRLGMESATGPTVAVAMSRELAAVICALLLSGRVGAAMAAEISSMKISDQLDALRSFGVYPVEYLVVPRFFAMLIAAPILTGLALVVGIGCAYIVAVPLLGVDGAYYWDNTKKFTDLGDVYIALSKGMIFGVLIAILSCHKGLYAPRNSAGVGLATTEAVVNSCLGVLISNFFFTFILNNIMLKS
jgi:phospholipid/cholesterol/gamma-HCH transport system permease protein